MVKTLWGFNLTILKVNLNPLWKNRSFTIGLRPLTSYCYPPVETYWHDHVQAPRPQTPSFLDSPASTSTPACVSLSSLVQQLNDHQVFDIVLNLGKPKYVWRQPPLNLTKDSHTQHNGQPKTWLGFSLLYLRKNVKPYTSYGFGLSWKILQKNILLMFRLIESNSRSIESDRIAQ